MPRPMHRLLASLGLLLFAATGHAELLYKSNNVEIYRASAESGARNEHPVRLEIFNLDDRLAEVSIVLPGKDPLPLLDDKTRLNLGDQLTAALRRVGPGEELHVITYRVVKSGILSSNRYASSARVFVQDGRINAIFGSLEQFQSEFRDPGKELPPMGSRARPSALEGKLIVSGTAMLAEGRSDWLQIPIAQPGAQAPIRYATPAPGQAAPAAPAAPPAKPAMSWQEVEEGLTTLNRMRERGLITQDDYDRMKKRLLDGATMPAQ